MLMPQEIEIWYVLPAIRKELAKAMSAKGMKQNEIARILSLAESAVSQYLKEKRAMEIEFDSEIKQEIGKSAEKIIADNSQLMTELRRICEIARQKKVICQIHKARGHSKECEVCLK